MWLILSVVIGGRLILQLLESPNADDGYEAIKYYYNDILLMLSVLAFPVLFSQIFGKLPLEYIRLKRASNVLERDQIGVEASEVSPEEREIVAKQVSIDDSAIIQMQKLAKSSREISEGLYTRAGVYLFIGVIIAFSGLAFFYIETAKGVTLELANEPVVSSSSNLLLMAPKFGILFFIEMVAFFFLRQYREAMDEYRYYESIKRKREENLVLMKLNSESEEKMNISDLLEKTAFYSEHKHLQSGETTEIIESRKLSNNEIALMEKMLATMGAKK
ncbi:hypothetical protein [Vibrio sp. Vb2917]|nr:hypothetical protein [Vibrio sp. Vb2917]